MARGRTLRARHDPPPGQRAVPTNGWKAVDELELIMRRWRATLDHAKRARSPWANAKPTRATSTTRGSSRTCKSACLLSSSRPSAMSLPSSSARSPCELR